MFLCFSTFVYPSTHVIVTQNDINVRVDSTVSAPSLGYLKQGEKLEVISQNYEWLKVRLPERFNCYVSSSYIEKLSETKGEVTASSLNLREEPSLYSNVLGQAKKGEIITIIEEVDGWYKIEGYPYLSGWVHSKFLREAEPYESSVVIQETYTPQKEDVTSSQEDITESISSSQTQEKEDIDPFAPRLNDN